MILNRGQAHFAVVEQKRLAGLRGLQDFRMRQVHARGVAGRIVGIEREGVALLHHGEAAAELSEPQFRPLQIDQDADRAIVFLFDAADRRDQLAHFVMRGVAHVDAEHVGAGLEQPGDHCAFG